MRTLRNNPGFLVDFPSISITTSPAFKPAAAVPPKTVVMRINKKAVLIQHGNYITVYKNLENVTVSTGDKVVTKQEIGTIFTDRVTGKTIIGFVLSKNTTTEDPSLWIYKM